MNVEEATALDLTLEKMLKNEQEANSSSNNSGSDLKVASVDVKTVDVLVGVEETTCGTSQNKLIDTSENQNSIEETQSSSVSEIPKSLEENDMLKNVDLTTVESEVTIPLETETSVNIEQKPVTRSSKVIEHSHTDSKNSLPRKSSDVIHTVDDSDVNIKHVALNKDSENLDTHSIASDEVLPSTSSVDSPFASSIKKKSLGNRKGAYSYATFVRTFPKRKLILKVKYNDSHHICEICKKTFVNLSGIRKHLHLFNSYEQFSCKSCNKSFKLGKKLKAHTAKCPARKTGRIPEETDVKIGRSTSPRKLRTSQRIANIQKFVYSEPEQKVTKVGKHARSETIVSTDESARRLSEDTTENVGKPACSLPEETIVKNDTSILRIHEGTVAEIRKSPRKTTEMKILKIDTPVRRTHEEILAEIDKSPRKISKKKSVNVGALAPGLSEETVVKVHTSHPTVPKENTEKLATSKIDEQSVTKFESSDTDDTPCHVCEMCEEAFTQPDLLRKHKLMHEYVKLQSCPKCQKSFTSSQGLQIHMRTHREEHIYNCSKCELNFPTQETLKLHVHWHSEDIFTCNDCGKNFILKMDLPEHRKQFHSEVQYTCEDCSMKFCSLDDLNQHCKIHVEEKSCMCEECGFQFLLEEEFNDHLKIHSRQNIYKCDNCGELCDSQYHLSEHLKMHLE